MKLTITQLQALPLLERFRLFVEWVADQPPETRYDFASTTDCVLCRFGRSLGFRKVTALHHQIFVVRARRRTEVPIFGAEMSVRKWTLAMKTTYGQIIADMARHRAIRCAHPLAA